MSGGAAWLGAAAVAAVLLTAAAGGATAREIVADPTAPEGLARALAEAQAGDVIRLPPGVYAGPVIVEESLSIEGEPGAVIDGQGIGRVVE